MAINGSARKRGNTALLIQTVFEALEIEGIETEINHFFLNHEMFIAGSTYWNMAYGQLPGDILKDEEGIANMRNLGENMSFLLKALHREAVELPTRMLSSHSSSSSGESF